MPLSLGLRMGLSASSSLFGWVPAVEGSSAAVAFNGTQFALPAYGPDLCSATTTTTVTTVAGKLYELSATGSGTITIAVGTTASGTNILAAATYATARYFTAVGTTTHLTVAVTSGSLTDILVREVMLGELGTNLGASGYTMTPGAGTATESPTGTLTLASGGTADLSIGSLTVGAHYRVVCLVATNAATVQVGTSSGGTQTVPATSLATGVGAIEFTATATTHHLRFTRASAGNTVVSSITVAQWTPRPTLRTATFSEVFAFTASSTTARTYVGADGLIKNDLAADAPRVDYSNGKARYLFENQSTNLLTWSADADQAKSVNFTATVTTNTVTAPDGTTTGDTVAIGANGFAYWRISTTTTGAYTGSIYLRADSATTIPIRISDNTGTQQTSKIVNLTTSWQRFDVSATMSPSITAIDLGLDVRNSVSGGDGLAKTVYVWGKQLEAQSFASSYIPTTSATVTRLIETARFSPLVEAIFQLPGATARVQGATLSFATDWQILGFTGAEWALAAQSATRMNSYDGSSSPFADSGPTPVTGYGGVWASNGSGTTMGYNGVAGTPSTAAAISNYNRTNAYLNRNSISYVTGNGYYSSFALYPFRATNANVSAIAVAPT
jgi:hypothetical protein